MEITRAPLVRHADEARKRVEDNGDDGQRQETHADAVPSGGDIEIHADAAEQSQSSKCVRLPGQFFELEALVDDSQYQRKRGPKRGKPAVGSFVPSEEGQESRSRKRVKERDAAGVALLRCGLAREEIQSGGDERNGEDA